MTLLPAELHELGGCSSATRRLVVFGVTRDARPCPTVAALVDIFWTWPAGLYHRDGVFVRVQNRQPAEPRAEQGALL